ncbi:hypothetical protein PIIN_08395 [Serendipita indica DSM 11827]|uniref:Uncharacterized protein n=1 Tax=Serendipita indica (strain DSM 11827) TaxID=1109443 RepID=G4TSZ9_SERID|nr:hypothetical protein PIIN_08395 [Serendipita indica DSM 11827]
MDNAEREEVAAFAIASEKDRRTVAMVEGAYDFGTRGTVLSRDDRFRIAVQWTHYQIGPSSKGLAPPSFCGLDHPHVFDLGSQNPCRRLEMRLSSHSFASALFLSFLALAGARPVANELVSSSQYELSTTTVVHKSYRPAVILVASLNICVFFNILFWIRIIIATIISSIPSVTLQRGSETSHPTETPVPNTPAGFFSNRNATILLAASVGGVVGVVLLLTLWINFRRSWYFPWNKKKQRNDPSRWSTYSFREKPRLPLGRTLPPTASTESFAKHEDPSHDGHESHGHMHEFDYNIPPLPEIRIDSPKSAHSEAGRQDFRRPPGLERFGRSSGMMSQYTVESVYSQPTDAETPEPFARSGSRSLKRVTSSSSDNSPFRFDPPPLTRNTPLLRSARSDEGHGARMYDASDRDTWARDSLDPVEATLRTLSGARRPGHAKEMSHFSIDEEDEREYDRAQRSLPSIGWKDTAANYGMVQSPTRNLASTLLTPKSPATPKSILKTPHYQTTSSRLAQTRQPSRI